MPETSYDMAESGAGGLRPISLVIPGRPEYIGLCRLVAGVVGLRESLDEESIADLKLLVTEACTLFLYGPVEREPEQIPTEAQASSVRVEFHVAPEAWEITISDPEHGRRLADSGTGHPMTEGGLRLAIISALADSVEHSETDSEGSVIRLVKRFPSSVGTDV